MTIAEVTKAKKVAREELLDVFEFCKSNSDSDWYKNHGFDDWIEDYIQIIRRGEEITPHEWLNDFLKEKLLIYKPEEFL